MICSLKLLREKKKNWKWNSKSWKLSYVNCIAIIHIQQISESILANLTLATSTHMLLFIFIKSHSACTSNIIVTTVFYGRSYIWVQYTARHLPCLDPIFSTLLIQTPYYV